MNKMRGLMKTEKRSSEHYNEAFEDTKAAMQ
jgi:hypothetical protein